MELVDGEVEDEHAKVYPPPPHIAARLFYRPTNQTRRKDSAASSRRNSISSAHSRSSHGVSLAGGPQSKYVAQHLRRASILEGRKARLADRAAHAEKVRVRAALAKSVTKSTSASEERALAAAQARERNLAEIAAACAEEVRRAKAVAETMKEKREQEIRKMKLQMEERLAEAEKRREELRSRNASKVKGRERGQSLGTRKPTSVEVMPEVKEVKEREANPLTEESAAARIQWCWKTRKRKHAVAEFSALGLSLDAVRETSFDEVTMLLSQENVLLLTARILRICGLDEGGPGSVEEMAAVRSFLSAFLILGHPSQVLSNKEEKETPKDSEASQAQPMSKVNLANPQSQELVGKARDLLVLFENILGRLTAFNSFTPPPALLAAFPEVYATFYNALIAWKARDSSSLVDLMVMQFVELDAIWESVKDTTDGSVDQVYKESIRNNQLLLLVRIKKLAGPSKGKQLVAEAVKAARKTRARKPVGDTKPRVADHAVTETAMGVLGVEESQEHPSQTQSLTPPPTPPRKSEPFKVSIVIPSGKSLLPDNRIVVHELAINKEFRTEPHEYHEQQEHLLAPLFEEMRATMQTHNQEAHFFLLLKRLLLDTEMSKRQFTMGSFSYEKFFQAMGSLLPKLCAPVRDDEAKVLVEDKLSNGSYVDRLEALNSFIDLAAPRLIEQAPTYEANAFAADLEAGLHDKLLAESSRRDPEGINHPSSRLTANRIYGHLLVDLFTQVSPVSKEETPEMLRLDHKRILEAGRLTRRVNLLKRDVRAPWRSEAARILAMPVEVAAEGIMAALEAGRGLAATRGDGEMRDPVLRLVLGRLRGHVVARVAAASASEKVRATSTAGEKLAGLGLAEFVELVRDMVEMMGRVRANMTDRDILPDNFKPGHYDLVIKDLDFEKWSYTGTVRIDGELVKPTTEIVLNTLELELLSSKIVVSQGKNDQSWDSTAFSEDTKTQRSTITFPQELPASAKVSLAINFTGELNHDMAGFYRSQYKPAAPAAASVPRDDEFHYMLSTQFEACDARRAFPCFDEPNLKATFDFAIEIPEDQVALSNMPQKETTPASAGKKLVAFERSPVMSTYLLAWAVGDFEYVEAFTGREYNGKKLPVRVYTTRGLKEQGRWALEHAPKIIDYFSEQFEIDYPLPKSDILAVHEFTHGAMENWGLVTYRMTAILFDEKLSEARFRNRIAYVVAHELAHQWFGNLVTMDWWDELWLNEGFATWAGWLATDYLHPDWEVWPQFINEGMDQAFSLDGVRSSHPIQVEVRDALDVNQIFDKISYLKGCSMIRMLASNLGIKTFLKGIAIYLQKHTYGNAKTEALWAALSEASGVDVDAMMKPWIEKVGFPVLTVTEGQKAQQISVKQCRFLSTGDVKPEDDTTTWWVPLALKGKVGSAGIEPVALTTKESTIDGVSDEFYQLNANATGFYRVNYPETRLKLLGTQLQHLTTEDKIFITGSAADLAFSGYATSAALLSFIQGLKSETHYRVLSQALDSIATLKSIFGDDEQIKRGLEKFTLELIDKALKQVGWEAAEGEDYNTGLLRKRLLLTAVANSHEDAVAALKKEWYTTPAIDGKEICLQALGHTADASIVSNVLLPFLFNPSPPAAAADSVPPADMHILAGVLSANRVGRPLLWEYMRGNWEVFCGKLGGNPIVVDRMVNVSLPRFTEVERLREIEEFFGDGGVSTKGFDRTLEQVKDKIRGRSAYRGRDVEGVRGWLVENGYA
ncbi:peptidase family M1-domain-containing protein [Staphylotrichum tortipilum]|uniref:Peptidase family M1-domain-containing protein n=1 Tax=Staphylotrichum tortipilum TaxID=2831512 RepID=A0AAN6MHE7_9PEZI|nr:peptidase family M1-domain-containing protein [Staphylotrichum longicolle]